MQKWVHLTLADGKTIDATEGHPFRTAEGWRDAILLKKGGQLLLKGEDGDALTVQIEDIRTETKVLTTYNLEVANAHTYFVGIDAVLVHNAKKCKGDGFRGGSKKQRDNWYGYNDKKFQRWWHREGKKDFGGSDIDNSGEAKEGYDTWIGLGRPDAK